MKLSRMKQSDWLMVIGAVIVAVFGTFVDWVTYDTGAGEISGSTAFSFFWRGTIPWLLIVGAGMLAFARGTGIMKTKSTPPPIAFVAANGVGLLLLTALVITGYSQVGYDDANYGRGVGMLVSFIGAIIATSGAVVALREHKTDAAVEAPPSGKAGTEEASGASSDDDAASNSQPDEADPQSPVDPD